jgi:hypothetical protein
MLHFTDIRKRLCVSGIRELLFFLIRIVGGWVQTGSTQRVGHFWPFDLPRVLEDGKFGAMKIGRGNLNTRRKPAPAPLCPPQIPRDQIRAWTWAAVVGSQQLTAWAVARPWDKRIRLVILWTYSGFSKTYLSDMKCLFFLTHISLREIRDYFRDKSWTNFFKWTMALIKQFLFQGLKNTNFLWT